MQAHRKATLRVLPDWYVTGTVPAALPVPIVVVAIPSSPANAWAGPNHTPATGDDAKAAARALIDRRLSFAASVLDAQPYLTGDSFTVADAYLFTVLSWTGFVKVDITPWPSLGAYFERIKARPAVQAAMAAEGLTG